ncbi:MerR family transcriptional regulator [Apilactobacillus micheneri]|uniref:MerR family transcriptional regulator n=1 Tax=Apilactobacillus micheneri TaxID=1899430 RepID=A0ABY2YWN3_9LACO|nr:MerR family transcriptional regulator [Apilactobacillus micheneri]TPR24496.1 MerR family transcriptional regulator [Apilactobacillus micheneri]TPR25807.1 MerR family transcriptional regulator [Apilactobacillus micheneri]TPR27997.1 MerR family transcriptional regulator [Apilactobacillus micheneri]TPR29488.1 MerR family transcriptional regulator [Apilactobacillus micheneri]TPR30274.1 MerR family transcriptional regulator [Apilactobacillus micheneri]
MQISEVTQKYNISKQTLYYWERIGLLYKIAKDSNGYRNYNEENLKQIEFVSCMRNAGMTINKLQKYMILYNSGEQTFEQRKQLIADQLDEIKYQVLKYKNAQQVLEYKLNHYKELSNQFKQKDAK